MFHAIQWAAVNKEKKKFFDLHKEIKDHKQVESLTPDWVVWDKLNEDVLKEYEETFLSLFKDNFDNVETEYKLKNLLTKIKQWK